MSSKLYYKHAAESDLGEGEVFLEAIDGIFTRQVEIYGDKIVWCDQQGQSDDRFMLADQPLNPGDFEDEDLMSSADFEDLWREAKSKA